MSETIPVKISNEWYSGIGKGCLICGECVEIKPHQIDEPIICDKCKAAVMKVRSELKGDKG